MGSDAERETQPAELDPSRGQKTPLRLQKLQCPSALVAFLYSKCRSSSDMCQSCSIWKSNL